MAWEIRCHFCLANLELDDPIGRSNRCPRCAADLRCCLNCRFLDMTSYNDCAEPSAERVLDKDRANFCDYFSAGGHGAASSVKSASLDGLSELEKLFRKA